MTWSDRIVVDPKTLTGKPVVRGTRISVELVVELLAAGWSHAQILGVTRIFPKRTSGPVSPMRVSFFARRRSIRSRSHDIPGRREFPRPALEALRNAGWKVFSVAEEYPGISDEEVASLFGEPAGPSHLRQGLRRARFPPRAFSRKRSRPVPAYSRIS